MAGPRVLVIDNFDSFTFTLVDYLKTLGADVRVERADAVSVDQALAAGDDAILISPGPGAPEDAGISVALAAACIEQH
ncbi:MAG: aminodeoxychorismate/anthranilate synthase component II, partial [Sphingomicrobium sp.]